MLSKYQSNSNVGSGGNGSNGGNGGNFVELRKVVSSNVNGNTNTSNTDGINNFVSNIGYNSLKNYYENGNGNGNGRDHINNGNNVNNDQWKYKNNQY